MTRPRPPADPPRLHLLSTAALILLAAGYVYLAVLAAPAAITVERAAAPWPDGAEYLDAAVSLVRDGTYRIHLAGEAHPPRYPFGYSLPVAAALALGAEPAAAPHLVNRVAAAALLVLLGLILWRRGRRLEAGLTVLLLATLPAFVILGRSPLSEVPSVLLVTVGVYLLYGYGRGAPPARGAWGALVLGLCVCFRTSNLFLVAFVPAAVVARRGLGARGAVRQLIVLGSFFALGVAPLLVYNAIALGDPLATGYAYWVPYWEASRAFGLQFVEPNLEYYWRELIEAETTTTTASVYGLGSYFTPWFVLLVAVSLCGLRSCRRLWPFALAALGYAATMMLYFYLDARLLLPLMVLALPLAAVGFGDLWRRSPDVGKIALGALLALAVSGLQLGSVVEGRRFEALALLDPPEEAAPAHRAVARFERLAKPRDPLVLTDMAPPYVHALVAEGALVAPLFDDHLYRHNPQVFVFKRAARADLVARALEQGREVWALTHAHDIFEVQAFFTAPAGHGWEIVSADGTAGIARLVALEP